MDIVGFHVRYKIDLFERVALFKEVSPRHAEGISSHVPFRNLVGEELAWFTPRARQVLVLARKEADRMYHNFVGTEHLLLGMISLGQGTAVTALEKMGVNLEKLGQDMEDQIPPGPEQIVIGNIPYTPRCKKVLHFAAAAAIVLNHTYIGTEHILLGLLMEGAGSAAQALSAEGVDMEKATKVILTELQSKELSPEEFRKTLDKLTSQYVTDLDESATSFKKLIPPQFTPRAQQVLCFASMEAVRSHHEYLGTEHLVAGLLRLGNGVAANVLLRRGIDLEVVRRKIAELIGRGPEREITEPRPYSEEHKKALARSVQEAKALAHTYIGTEHLLLGILDDESGHAGKILKNLGLDPQALRQEILSELNPNA